MVAELMSPDTLRQKALDALLQNNKRVLDQAEAEREKQIKEANKVFNALIIRLGRLAKTDINKTQVMVLEAPRDYEENKNKPISETLVDVPKIVYDNLQEAFRDHPFKITFDWWGNDDLGGRHGYFLTLHF